MSSGDEDGWMMDAVRQFLKSPEYTVRPSPAPVPPTSPSGRSWLTAARMPGRGH